MLPGTKQLPLEEMKNLFTESPWFIPNSPKSQHLVSETRIRAQQIEDIGLDSGTAMTEHDEVTV